MTDHDLRQLLQQDLNAGADALYQQYKRYVYTIIFRILRDCGTREDVEDCLAETFAEVIRRREQIRGESMKAYLGQTAHNKALNYARSLQKQRFHNVPLDETEPAPESVQAETEQKALQRQLLAEIQALGDPDATILVQKYYFNRSMKDIAELVGLTPNATKVRCSRALKRLRKELAEWE